MSTTTEQLKHLMESLEKLSDLFESYPDFREVTEARLHQIETKMQSHWKDIRLVDQHGALHVLPRASWLHLIIMNSSPEIETTARFPHPKGLYPVLRAISGKWPGVAFDFHAQGKLNNNLTKNYKSVVKETVEATEYLAILAEALQQSKPLLLKSYSDDLGSLKIVATSYELIH